MLTEPAIVAMVDRFYAKVRGDPVLAPVFERVLLGNWEAHMPRLYGFWTKVLLGQGDFQGNVFGKHMALAGIEPEHFTHWLRLFRETVEESFDAEDADRTMQAAERIAVSLQLGFFGKQVT